MNKVQKWMWEDPNFGLFYGISACNIDTSPEQMLVDLVEIGTYQAASDHRRENGDLPRKLWSGIDGTRSQQYCTVKSLPAPYDNQVFEGWWCWKKEVKGGR